MITAFLKSILPAIFLIAAFTAVEQTKQNHRNMSNYYCEYCGHKFPDVRLLVSTTCVKHPDGSHKGKHKLYEGSEKSEYTCKYCGRKFNSIMLMTSATCSCYPKGSNKGGHAPAL